MKKEISYDDMMIIGQPGFFRKWLSKLLFTLISVKVWGLVAGTWISTYLLLIHEQVIPAGSEEAGIFTTGINGAQWVTFNTTIWALIFGMKEIFRIQEQKDKDEKEVLVQQSETKKELAKIMTSESSGKSKFTADGKEMVGDDPHD